MTLPDIAPPPSGAGFSVSTEGGYTVVSLSGELDVACTPVLREQLLGVLRPRASRLVIDLSDVSFCDASGLAVLVGTGRRARLLGGVLRLAAPSPAVVSALRLGGLLGQFDVFPTVLAAIAQPQTAKQLPATGTLATKGAAGRAGPARQAAPVRVPDALAAGDLRDAVTALLAHADAWRDADPERRFTTPLRALARAAARDDHTALAKAARSLLVTLTRYPLNYSPAVAATASNLRHLIGTGSSPPVLT